MRKIKFFFVLLMCLFFQAYAENKNDLPPANFNDSFIDGTNNCAIHLKKSYVTTWSGPSEKLEYSVYCNNHFMQPDSYDGGTLIGCRQPGTTPKDSNPITPLILNGKKVGWWATTGDSCGTQSFSKYALVYPVTRDVSTHAYLNNVFTTNFLGITARPDPSNKGIEVWYGRYVWCGASATSIAVPHMATIPYDSIDQLSNKLPSQFSSWPQAFKPNDYQTAFLAGLANQNLDVLESSKELLKHETFTAKDGCYVEGLPRTLQKLDEIINALKTLDTNHVLQFLNTDENVQG